MQWWAACGTNQRPPAPADGAGEAVRSPVDAADLVPRERSSAVEVKVRGRAYDFVAGWGHPVVGATVTCPDRPGLEAVTDADGLFTLEGLHPGDVASFRMTHSDYAVVQTAALTVGAEGLEEVTFQAPALDMYALVQGMLGIEPEPDRCQIAATVTTLADSERGFGPTHGEPGVTVAIAPALDGPAMGPVYWKVLPNYWIVPDPELTETTEDGGVIFLNVLPGRYVLDAHKPGALFSVVQVDCAPGVLVNAAPPHGLQLQE